MIYLALTFFIIYQLMDFFLQADQHGWIWSTQTDPMKLKCTWWWTWPTVKLTYLVTYPTYEKSEYFIRYRLRINRSSTKWPWYIDWIPRDPWHLVQFTRTTFGMAAYIAFFWAFEYHWWMIQIGGLILAYALTRALAFTIPMKSCEDVRSMHINECKWQCVNDNLASTKVKYLG